MPLSLGHSARPCAFLNQYPKATALVVAHDVAKRFTRRDAGVALTFVSLRELLALVTA